MLFVAFFCLFVPVLGASTVDIQVPLESTYYRKDDCPIIYNGYGYSGCNLDELPSPNSTDHLIFDTVYSLLQHWPNTRMRKGHNLVPGIIPKGTLLYHGTIHKVIPPGQEWVATDPEHAYTYCWDVWSLISFQVKCWFLTLMTVRPLNVIYLDGSSGAKFTDGTLDAQDLFIWGESRPEAVLDESKRIAGLCGWVEKFGMDGIVRMGIDFEVMLCDFTSGVSQVSFLNLEPPTGVIPPAWGLAKFEAVNAHSRHNRLPGETRIQLDLTRLVSFYDIQLAPSLVPFRASLERWDYRVQNISKDDLLALKTRVEEAMTSPWGSLSGIDWKTLVQVIVDLYAQRLELLRHFSNSPAASPQETIDLANKTQTQLRIMLTPYILLSAGPTDPSDKNDAGWSMSVYKLCATTHTYSMEHQLDSMTYSERLILQAVQGTLREICRVLTKMWVAGVYEGVDSSLNTKEFFDVGEIARLRHNWAEDLKWLMGWLDWSVWVKCDPECGPEELCYLPTWPIGFPGIPSPPGNNSGSSSDIERQVGLTGSELRMMAMGRFAQEMSSIVRPESDEWIRPQPKCIRRIAPYEF